MRQLFNLRMTTIVALCLLLMTRATVQSQVSATPALAGFDDQTNGFLSQTQFDAFKAEFAEIEGSEEGLGPLYNATSCVDCHQSPVTGGASQVTELRAGRYNGATFTPHPGGSVVHDRATNETIQQRMLASDNVRAFRSSAEALMRRLSRPCPPAAK